MAKSVLRDKSYEYAVRIVKCTQYLRSKKKEYVLSNQLLRSGTAIGALVREAEFAQSRADFSSKMSMALKEANENDYWISLLMDTGFITKDMYDSLGEDTKELIAMLVNTVRNTQDKQESA